MSNTYKDLQNSHPCFGGQKNNVGRIHLPVSPGCNIACRFCDRVISDTENRPGVTSTIIEPEESIELLEKALNLCPEIRVAGIAGPGDTLATDNAFKTFRLIKEKFPKLIKCMSTNYPLNCVVFNRRCHRIASFRRLVAAKDTYIMSIRHDVSILFA